MKKAINEDQLDDLYQSLQTLIHYYQGMMRDMAEDNYDLESVERDYEALMSSEIVDPTGLLAEIIENG